MPILIIGAGQAALTTAEKYRAMGGEDELIILGEEPVLPYQRPPLSKAYLAGDMPLERLYLRPREWFEKNNITMRPGCRIEAINRSEKSVRLDGGEHLAYDKLVLATGARARPLPREITADAAGIYTLRGLEDIDSMRPEFQAGRRLLVIGGGYIGLEAAAIARKLGLDVTVVEAAPRILGRVASEETADFIRDMHLGKGVEFHEGKGLASLDVSAGRVAGATLTDGTRLKVDFVIAGIGILANTELAEEADIRCDEGILINGECRTSDPDIYACGDCTRFEYKGEQIRLESVGNAIDQGEVVAANLAGHKAAYMPKPWFWSDQYDLTLQIAGLNRGYDDTIVRPGPREGTQSVWYYAADQLIAVDALGDPRAYMIAKRLIDAGKNLPKDIAGDAEANLKDWL
ncbi:NAD(P)/FAD-dependent oxidoreductase [Alphaproteobacteria bacterium LSUCC0684]